MPPAEQEVLLLDLDLGWITVGGGNKQICCPSSVGENRGPLNNPRALLVCSLTAPSPPPTLDEDPALFRSCCCSGPRGFADVPLTLSTWNPDTTSESVEKHFWGNVFSSDWGADLMCDVVLRLLTMHVSDLLFRIVSYLRSGQPKVAAISRHTVVKLGDSHFYSIWEGHFPGRQHPHISSAQIFAANL